MDDAKLKEIFNSISQAIVDKLNAPAGTTYKPEEFSDKIAEINVGEDATKCLSGLVSVGGDITIDDPTAWELIPDGSTPQIVISDQERIIRLSNTQPGWLYGSRGENDPARGYIAPLTLSLTGKTFDLRELSKVMVTPGVYEYRLLPSNIAKDVSIFGVVGTYVTPNDSLEVNSRIRETFTVYPTANGRLISQVTINPVPTQDITVPITAPGYHLVEPTSGKLLSSVNFTIPEAVTNAAITHKGTEYDFIPDEEDDGGEILIRVNTGFTMNASTHGWYEGDSEIEHYFTMYKDIKQLEPNDALLPENIKAGVSIFNVVGTYAPVGPTGTFTVTQPYTEHDISAFAKLTVNEGIFDKGDSRPTGVIATIGTVTPKTTDQYVYVKGNLTLSGGWLSNSYCKISGDANLLASNIKNGVSIFGVNGTYQGLVPSGNIQLTQVTGTDVTNYATASVREGVCYGSASLTELSSGHVGQTAITSRYFKITPSGVVTTSGWISSIPNGSDQYYYVSDVNLIASNIKEGVSILGVTGTVHEGITPTGDVPITAAGYTDVTNYARAYLATSSMGTSNAGTNQGSITPSDSAQYVNVTAGYTTAKKYTINAVPTETKTVTPTSSLQSITPTSGKFLSKVTVNAVPILNPTTITVNGTYTPDSGKFFNQVVVDVPSGISWITEFDNTASTTTRRIFVEATDSSGYIEYEDIVGQDMGEIWPGDTPMFVGGDNVMINFTCYGTPIKVTIKTSSGTVLETKTFDSGTYYTIVVNSGSTNGKLLMMESH